MSDVLQSQEGTGSGQKRSRKVVVMTVLLWVVQVFLAANFLFAGGFKLFGTDQMLAQFYPGMPNGFLRFIAVCEILGALGLVGPGIVRRWRWLTPLAACGLLVIMVGAVVYSVVMFGWMMAISPLVGAVLSAVIAYGRRDWGFWWGQTRS